MPLLAVALPQPVLALHERLTLDLLKPATREQRVQAYVNLLRRKWREGARAHQLTVALVTDSCDVQQQLR